MLGVRVMVPELRLEVDDERVVEFDVGGVDLLLRTVLVVTLGLVL